LLTGGFNLFDISVSGKGGDEGFLGVEQAEDYVGDESETRLARDALAQLTADVGAMLFWSDGDLQCDPHE
jgi:hypothetical protein